MARPVKNSCDYFPHDTGMRNHRKIKSLRQKYKATGYAIWCMLLELLTGSDGNVFEDSEMELEIISGDFDVSVAEIRGVLDYCYKLELLFLNNGFVSSESLDERLKPVYDKRKKNKDLSAKQKRISGKYYSNAVSPDIPATEMPKDAVISATEMPQSKVKESKVNKTIPLPEFGEIQKVTFLKVKEIFFGKEYEVQDDRVKAKYTKQVYDSYCAFVKKFVKFEECVANHSFIGIEFYSEHIFNKSTDAEISKAVTKMCGLTIGRGVPLTARFLDVLENMVKSKNTETKNEAPKPEGVQKEYWEIHYGHLAKTKEEFMALVNEGKINE